MKTRKRPRVNVRPKKRRDSACADPAPADAGVKPGGGMAEAAALTALAMRQPEVRRGVVRALRQRIADGTYAVDTRELARAILADPLRPLDDKR